MARPVRLVLALGVAGVLAEDVLDVPDYGEFVSVWPEPQQLTTTANGTTARLSKALRVRWRGACAPAPLSDDEHDDDGCGIVARAWARLNASLWALAPGTPPHARPRALASAFAGARSPGFAAASVAAAASPPLDELVVRVDAAPRAAPLALGADESYALCLLYTSPSPRDGLLTRMPSSA